MKRFVDLLLIFLASAIVVPVTVLVAFSVLICIGSPVLFTQQRPGHNGKPFQMLKFRTMTNERDPEGRLLPDSVRLTSFGRFLRSTSLDELPELWNVLKGEMSLVGPRPLLMEYLDRYSLRQARRHEVRPGITGWAQVNGRNAIGWQERFDLDVWYVDNRTLVLDLKILYMTVIKVLKKSGITDAHGHSMAGFMGNGKDKGGSNYED